MQILKFPIIVSLCLSFFFQEVMAQRWELGMNGGLSNYTGDLAIAPVRSANRPSAGIFTRVKVNNVWSLRANIQYAGIQGNDSLGKGVVNRNLHFRSNIWELSTVAEVHFRPFGDEPLTFVLAPYFFIGLGVATFNPQAKYVDTWVNLQPLGTEGQRLDGGKGYSRVAMTLPVGLGIKYLYRKAWVIGAEVGYRFTTTDYLDDVSKNYPDLAKMQEQRGALATYFSDPSVAQNGGEPLSNKGQMRGNAHINDAFIIMNLHLAYRFVKSNCFHKFY